MLQKILPVGIEDFDQMRKEDFYYVDKTGFISDLMSNWGSVNLFTRPRRFGKTLNMSMLKSFFEIGGDGNVFDGTAMKQIEENKYYAPLRRYRVREIWAYAIAFWDKECRVALKRM